MWDRLLLPPKLRQRHGDAHSHDDLDEHQLHPANLVFRNASEPNLSLSQSPPPSSSKSSRLRTFKRYAMGDHPRRVFSPKTPLETTFGTRASVSQFSLGPSTSAGMYGVVEFRNDVEAMAIRTEDKPPRLPSVLCAPNDLSSLWQIVCYSMGALADSDSKGLSATAARTHDPTCPWSPSPIIDSSPPSAASSPGTKGPNPDFSDTVFTSMTRSSRPQSPESHPKRKSSPARAFSGAKDFDADLDPHAPSMTVTQPGPTGNAGLIFLLKTQLMLQTELRKQLERDLCSRDELVKDLEEKLAERELAEAVQLAMLKQCKTKVEELERSRQESMQRSIMDEASAESLRIACCYLAGLQREKESWKHTEETLHMQKEMHREAGIRLEREMQELLAAAELYSAGDDKGATGGRRSAFTNSAMNNSIRPAARASPVGAASHTQQGPPSTPTPLHPRVGASPVSNLKLSMY